MTALPPSNQTTPVRPFAPDDFRREKKRMHTPHSSASKTFVRPPTVLQSPMKPEQYIANEDIFLQSSMRRSSLFEGDGNRVMSVEPDRASASAGPCKSNITAQTPLRTLQDEAEKEWQSRSGRRSSLGLLPSHLQSSLAKSAIVNKSESFQSLFDQQRYHRQREHSGPNETWLQSSSSPTYHLRSTTATPQQAIDRDCIIQRKRETMIHGEKDGKSSSTQSQRTRTSFDALQKAKSIISMSSSKIGSVGDNHSTLELLRDSSIGDRPQQLYKEQQSMIRKSSFRPRSLHVSSHQQPMTPRRPHTSNHLSSDEKTNQVKRSLKLATMLGSEWQRETGDDWLEKATCSDSPLRGVTARSASLLRRQSDPLHLQYTLQSKEQNLQRQGEIFDEDHNYQTTKLTTPMRWKSRHFERSRSSLNLKQDVSGEIFHSLGYSLSAPPLDIHPKAAALLGLCVDPHASASPVHSSPSTHLPSLSFKDSARMFDKCTTTSSSSMELLKDSDSIHGSREQAARWRQEATDKESNIAIPMGEDEDSNENSASLNREERRRRVKKISRWLGAVVPPHLILPNPEHGLSQQKNASGYNLDEAPSSPFIDYISGSPITPSSKSRTSSDGFLIAASSASNPLIRVKAAANVKLNKRAKKERLAQFSAPPITLQDVTSLDNKEVLTEREHKSNVKRNHKLISMFGEAPPQNLLSTSQSQNQVDKASTGNRRKSLSPISGERLTRKGVNQSFNRGRHFRSVSPSALTTHSPQFPSNFLSDLESPTSDNTTTEHHRESLQCRVSIDSLEYLIKKDPPLLNDLVSALEEDELSSNESVNRHALEDGDALFGETAQHQSEPAQESASSQDESGRDSPRLSEQFDGLVSVDSSMVDFSSSLEVDEKSRAIRRHQKLGRWFGEQLPNHEHSFGTADTHLESEADKIYFITSPTVKHFSQRTPLSAGSTQQPDVPHQRKALSSIINSI